MRRYDFVKLLDENNVFEQKSLKLKMKM